MTLRDEIRRELSADRERSRRRRRDLSARLEQIETSNAQLVQRLDEVSARLKAAEAVIAALPPGVKKT